MISVNSLLRESERLSAYIAEDVRLAGAEDRETVVTLFDHMQVFFPQWVISVCPMMNPALRFMSKNAPHLFGYSVSEMLDNSPLNKYFELIHAADQEAFFQCITHIHDFLEEIPSEEHELYRFGLHYRFRKSNGQFIYLYDEKAVMKPRSGGNLYYTLFRDLTAEKTFSGVRVDLYTKNELLEKIREFKPMTQMHALSKRERELISLIRQGLSTKEMAWYLNISQHTVRNLKSKLFGKYQVSNSIELLNMAS